MTVYVMYPWWQQKAPTLLQIGVLREGSVMFFLGGARHGMAVCITHEHSVREKCQVQGINTLILEMTTLS